MRPRDVICLRKVPAFSDWTLPLFALSVLAALGHLSHRERQGVPGRKPFTTIRLSGGTRIEGSRKTVNGAYRYRYAPFLVPIYDALALPLGELSPQVTERALRPRDVICLRRCQHFPIGRCRYLPSPSSLRSATSPTGRQGNARTETVLRPSDFRAARALRGSRKTVNGAYRYRYAPFLCANIRCLGSPFGRAVTTGD